MWDTSKDYMIWGFAILLAAWQLVEEARKGKSKAKMVVLSIGIILFFWLGLDQINRAKNDKNDTDTALTDLNSKVDGIQKAKSRDSLTAIENHNKDSVFQKKLLEEFKITRDSIANKPMRGDYVTNINNAKEVKIGPR